ncbi:protein TORNADO 1 [Curcuma longa]|uniref:protein TORNADO 1 n=1 Tax=Curcuma longa TaxID=136217 RepID=UPI003D9DB27D
MSISTSTSNLHAALHTIRSANTTLQNVSFYQSTTSSSTSLLTESSLSINISTDREGVQFFCAILDEMISQGGNLKNLMNLSFHGVQWEQRQLQSLCSFLATNSSIKHLELERCMFEKEGLRELSGVFDRNGGIKAAVFSECHIESTGARFLSLALAKNDTLEELQIWEDSVGSKGAEDLARMIEVNPTLKLLIVFDKESFTATPLISAILARNRNLEVHIWSRDNSDRSSKVVEFTPESNTLRIYKLNASGSQRVACALAWNTTVRTLDMTGIKLKTRWAREFRVSLEQNQTLKDVKLSRACLRDKAVVYIAAGLFVNQKLENLQLDQNWFTGVGVDHLLCPLSRFSPVQKQANTTLKSLILGGGKTKIGKDGLIAILRMLETNQTVTRFSISGDSSMKPDDIIKIFRALERNATLQCISLEGCVGVQGDMVLQTIMQTLQTNPWIEEIDLARTPLQISGKTDKIYEKLGQNGSIVPEDDFGTDLPLTSPRCCRIFFCGQEYAGKSTLCNSIFHSMNTKLPYADHMRTLVISVEQIMRRADVKIKIVYDGDIKISIWNFGGQHENFELHDLIFPSYGSPSFFLIVSSLFRNHPSKELKSPDEIEDDILYWIKFIVSNSRRGSSQSMLPYVSIVLTHWDRVSPQSNVLQTTAISIQRLRERFQGFVDIYPTVFMVDARSSMSVSKLARHLRKTSETILQRVPQVFELCNEMAKILSEWRSENTNKPVMKWKEFCELCQLKVSPLRLRSRFNNVDRLEKRRCAVANSLHLIGEVIFFEDLRLLILDCEWFWGEVLNLLVRLDVSKAERREKDGFMSRRELERIVRRTMQNQNSWMGANVFDNLEANDLIKIMLKLELCYEKDPGNSEALLLIPSLLTEGRGGLQKWQVNTSECVYVGRKMECDHSHMFLTKGFFPRLQVHLYNKLLTLKIQQGAVYSLEKNLIDIFINGVHIQVEAGGQLSSYIDVIACSTKSITETLRLFHQFIIPAIQSIAPSITFTEKIIRPDCVEHRVPSRLRTTQCVPLQQIKQALLSMPADSMYDYQHTWSSVVSDTKIILQSGSDYARDLLSDEDFREVLHRRYYDLHHVAAELAVPTDNSQESPKVDANETQYTVEPSLTGIAKGVEVVLQRLKILEQEIQDLKQEIQGLRYYEHQILIELRKKVDYIINFNIEMEERKVPRLFYFVQMQNNARRLITGLVPGMTALRLHMLCEYRREMHVVDDQIGCELMQLDNQAIKSLLPYMAGLMKLLTFALKIGVSVVAGMGHMIPDLAREFAHLMDSSLVYGTAAMAAGGVFGYVVTGQAGRRFRNRSGERNVAQEVVGAEQWLVDFLKSQKITTGKDIAERFGLWRVRYRDSGSIAWICRKHMILRKYEIAEVPV